MPSRHLPTALVTIDPDNRVQFPAGLRPHLAFFKENASVKGWIRVGKHRQLVGFADQKVDSLVGKTIEALLTEPLSPDEERSLPAAAVRSLFFRFECTFNYEPSIKSFRMTLPVEVRDLELVPRKGKPVLLVCFGGFFEIWCADTLPMLTEATLDSDEIDRRLSERWSALKAE